MVCIKVAPAKYGDKQTIDLKRKGAGHRGVQSQHPKPDLMDEQLVEG